MNQTTPATMLLITLIAAAILLSTANTAKAEDTIRITADGTVTGTNQIHRQGNTYTFTGNIENAHGITIEADNIQINGANYTLKGAETETGITITYRTNITVTNLQITNYFYGIILDGSLNCNIHANTLKNRVCGIWLYRSQNTVISHNLISESGDSGIQIDQAADNTIRQNTIANNSIGIWINGATNTTFHTNNITDNTLYGIMFTQTYQSTNNAFYNNNFINNPQHVITYEQQSTWNTDAAGNYWSDYTGNDQNHDGIGDTPYIIDANNTDRKPLVTPAAIPELPSWIMLPLLSLATLFAVIIKKKALQRRDSLP